MALRVYTTPVTIEPADIYIKVVEVDEGLHLKIVNRDGTWVRHLLTLSEKRGIVRNYSARDVGFPTDSEGRIVVDGGGR